MSYMYGEPVAVNPKAAFGDKKPNLALIPPSALLHLATAMMNGASKYGPYNWRENAVELMTYIAAMKRHTDSFLDGESFSADTVEAGAAVHHLAHVMACCAIMLDAIEIGNAVDNRPLPGRAGAMIENYAANKSFTLKSANDP